MSSSESTPSTSHFMAHMSRLKLIFRWPLMRNISRENVQEHSHQVAVVAHCLAIIKNAKFGGDVNAQRIATAALFHDASEVLTGDLPSPVKYFNNEIAGAYKEIERFAEHKLLEMVPDEFKAFYRPLLVQDELPSEEKAIIKAADTLCAYIKTLEELHAGNHEFIVAKKRLEDSIEDSPAAEVRYFLDVFIPSFTLSLDEIARKTPMAESQQ